MRKPRDFDAELKALVDKARNLKSRKVQQLGELVVATGADALIHIQSADHALYRAKSSGRNAVARATEAAPSVTANSSAA